MREIRTSGLMSGDGKRGNATAPVLDSTEHSRDSLADVVQASEIA